MNKTILVLIILNFVAAFFLFFRVGLTKYRLRRSVNLYEWHFAILILLIATACLDVYFMISGYYQAKENYTFILSYSIMGIGPVMHGIVQGISLKEIVKNPLVFLPISLYVVGSTLLWDQLYKGNLSWDILFISYFVITLYTLLFVIFSTIKLLINRNRDPLFRLKLFFCILFLIHGFGGVFTFGSYYMMVHLTINFVGVLYYGVQPLLMDSPSYKRKEKYAGTKQSQSMQDEILGRFVKKMEEDQLYLDPHCKLEAVAKEIDVRRDQLSQAINREYHMRFTDVINQYRIQHSLDLLSHSDNILEVALDSGFYSRSSFYSYFKRITKMTPKEYKIRGGELEPSGEWTAKV